MHYEKFADGTIKCIEDEIPFEVPESWAWCRLGGVLEIARGGSPRPIQEYLTTSHDGINWIKIGDADKNGKYIYSTKERIKSEGVSKSRRVYKGNLLLTNSMSFGRPYILQIDGCIHDGWLVLSDLTSSCYIDFLYYLLSSPLAYQQFAKIVSGSVVKNLNSNKAALCLIPLPPTSEQKRVVEIIKKIISIASFIQFHTENLNTIIIKTKEKILDLAIRGKLVPQDHNDESASVLLERIRVQKEELIKQGKIKRDKRESVIYRGTDNSYYERFADGSEKCINEEIPFEIPKGWAWGRIFSITTDLSYGTAKKSLTKGKIAVIRMGNIQAGEINYDDLMYSSDEADILKYCLEKNDLLFNRTNSPDLVGKTAIYRGDIPAIYAGYLIRIHTFIDSEYLNIVMNSNYARRYYNLVKTDGVNQSNINAKKLAVFIIPIPPFEEQRRIAKQEKTIRSILFECMR